MKKILDSEKFNLGDVLKRGLSVRDEIVNEFNLARSKFAQVNWQNELEAFKNSPIDTAQSYLNQVNEALRTREDETVKSESAPSTPTPETKPTVARKPRAASAKSPRAKKPVAKKPVAKKPVAKKPAAKKPAAKKSAGNVTVNTGATVRVAKAKSKTTRTTATVSAAK